MRGAFIVALLILSVVPAHADESDAWVALRGNGHVALIRHAQAPGTLDPEGYRLDDCSTQRQLSEKGRADARKLGDIFRAQKVKVGKIVSSQWCRCRHTAELMDLGPVEQAPTFNNAAVLREQRDELAAGGRKYIAAWRGPGTLIVATHGANVLAMLGVHPAQGEVIVVKPDAANEKGMTLVGRIRPAF